MKSRVNTASGNDEDFADLIRQETEYEWDDLKEDLSRYPAAVLIEILTELGLYVNKQLALEIAKKDNAVFYLRKLIQDGHYWYINGPGDTWSPIHAIHILALIKSKEALQLLLDTIRFRGEDLDAWLTESIPALLVAFGEDSIEELKEFTQDETLEPFARGTVSSALTALAKKFPSYEENIKSHLINLLKTTRDDVFAGLVADDLASFHDPSVKIEILKAFLNEKIDRTIVSKDEIIATIEGVYTNIDNDEFKKNTEDPIIHFSRENIEHLHLIYSEGEDEKDDDFELEEQEIMPKKEKIGRNDPCPCGSGKKYKKCCMGKEKS
ncbi:MAG TPA: DUF1186 domain-containing protein [Candidatus Methanoperedens sp.]